MRFGQPNENKSVLKFLGLFLLVSLCLFLFGCQYWYRDMKGFLEHWTGTVSVADVSWSASPAGQKNASGVDTVSTNAAITATVGIINPDGYPLDGGIGSDSDTIRSVRISGAAGTAALARASVTSLSSTSMKIEIAPLSMVPTPESLALEHTDFMVEFAPTRSDNAMQSSARRSLTLRYNTPPRMPLEVVEDGGTLKFLDGTKQWGPVTGSLEPALNGYIFWAYPSGITDPTHPDCAVSFRVTNGTHIEEQAASAYLMAQNPTLSSLIPRDLVDRGYELYCYSVSTPTVATKVEAVDNEGVSSYSAESGRTIYEIILNANGGSFGSRDTVTVFRAAGAALNGGDLDIPTRSGHYLSGWTVGGSPVTFPYTVSEPLTLTARWTANPSSGSGGSDGGTSSGGGVVVPSTYTVTFNAGDGQFADGSSRRTERVQSGAAVSQPPAPTRAGWVFTWWKDPATGSAYDFSKPVTSTLTLTANWVQEFYVNPNGGKDGNPGTQVLPLASIQAAVEKIGGINDGISTYTILLMGDVVDSSSGSYDSGKNSALVNIVPAKTLSLTIKSDTDGVTRIINAGRNATNTGRVMYVGDKATVTLRDLVLTGGYADNGGGVIVASSSSSYGSLVLESGSIRGNTATANGGGVYMNGGNFSMTGGSVGMDGSPNRAWTGGGISTDGGRVDLSGGSVSYNEATANGGGVYVNSRGNVSVSLTVISHNNAATSGGGVCLLDGELNMRGGIISSNQAASGGGGVHVGFGSTFEMTGGTVSTNAGATRGNGVSLSGTLTMTGGTISGNGSSGVYANSAQAINFGGSAVIAADNDIQLGNGKVITIVSPLTSAAPVAAISPFNYTIGAQILSAGSGVTLASEVGKFTVVASGSDTYIVGTDATNPASGVLAKGIVVAGADAAVAISVLSGSETYTVRVTGELTEEQIIGTDGIRNELLSLTTSSPDTKVVLDLSGTTITSLPDDAFYSSSGNTILTPTNLVGVVVPSSLQTIGCGTFRSAGLTSVVFADSDATWKIEGRDGAVVEANFQPSATSTAAAIEYLTGPTSDRNMEMDMTFTNAYKWTKNN